VQVGRLNAAAVGVDFRREALSTQLGRKFITLSVHLICLQHVRRDAARRVGLSAAAGPCFRLESVYSVPFSALTPLDRRQEEHPACKNTCAKFFSDVVFVILRGQPDDSRSPENGCQNHVD